MGERGLRCVALACSPRREGNTALLAREALRGAASVGSTTHLIYLRDHRFGPCLACDGCFETGRCVVEDDAGLIYQQLLAADRLILAAPVFSMGICAQAKMFIDRAQQFWATRYLLYRPVVEDAASRPERRGIFISTAGTRLPDVFAGALQVARYFFKILEVKLVGAYCYPGVDEKGAILRHPWALGEVYRAGRELGSEGPATHVC
ncbi:MAG: flavodoxin family protein [Firmicutes bacterium]|nr:flavodoxin family protein [Bacillota bacterium]